MTSSAFQPPLRPELVDQAGDGKTSNCGEAGSLVPEWETAFRSNTHLSAWPWSDLVSYVHRHATPLAQFRRVLELGCGMGANIPFFIALGLDYCAIEQSTTAVARLHERYPRLREAIVAGDFSRSIPLEGIFDLVVDRAATQHNATEAVRRAIVTAYDRLRPGGKLIGIDWVSGAHSDAKQGTRVDEHTRRDLPSRAFAGLGLVHFFEQSYLIQLLTSVGFAIECLEHKVHEVVLPADSGRPAWWNFVAVKP